MSEQYVAQVDAGVGVPGLSWLAVSANLIPNAGLPGGSSLLVTRRVDCWLAECLLPRVSISAQRKREQRSLGWSLFLVVSRFQGFSLMLSAFLSLQSRLSALWEPAYVVGSQRSWAAQETS